MRKRRTYPTPKDEVLGLTMLPGTADVWRNIAASLGYFSSKGPLVYLGSPSRMFQSLLDGKLSGELLQQTIMTVIMTRQSAEEPKESKPNEP